MSALRRRYGLGRPAARRRRRLPGLSWLRLPSRRVVLALVVLAALLASGWFWLRDSSLVAVKRVGVSGLSGQDAGQIRAALIIAARNMTTLDVHMDQLRSAVGPYPVVKDLRVSAQFPHGMRIRVIEQLPVGVIVLGGRRTAVAGDGTVLHDVTASQSLPVVPLTVAPGGARITDSAALGAVHLLAAAPSDLLQRIVSISIVQPHGFVAQLRSGPDVYLGDSSKAAAKWVALDAVLAAPGSPGATYIDLTDPARPAAGPAGSAGATSAVQSASSTPGG